MKILPAFSLSLIFYYSFIPVSEAQVMRKFFYNNRWELTTRDSASFVRMCGVDTTARFFAGPVRDMYITGKPQMTGTYIFPKEPNLRISSYVKEGIFTFYYDNGQIESTGAFKLDRRDGIWKYYHPNGQLKMEVEFAGNNIKPLTLFDNAGKTLVSNGDGSWLEEYEEPGVKGKVIVTGELKSYLKHGEWTCKLSTGELIYSEKYNRGEYKSGFLHIGVKKIPKAEPAGNHVLLPFKFEVTEKLTLAPGVTVKEYPAIFMQDLTSDSIPRETFTIVEESASPVGGMGDFYREYNKYINYPPAARKAGISGKVL
jgi:MORN repeat variant